MIYDLHLHSNYSDGLMSVETIFQKAKELNISVVITDHNEIRGSIELFEKTLPPMSEYIDIKTYMTEDILVKVDRMSMAHSLEVRAPILDHKLMEFAATLPSGLKLNNRESKYILKKINERRLPHDILYRKKQGFRVPLAQWLREGLRDYISDTLFGQRNNIKEYLNDRYVKRLWENHLKGMNDHSSQIWNIFMFELWRRQFS
jgi:asparagine synthase (glutamine-hydrolysing)